MPDSSRREFFCLGIALSALYFLLLSVFVASVPIGSNSEAREAHIIQGMLSSGEWLLPDRNGIVASKPPLFHWTAAFIARTTGASAVIAARLLSAAAASFMLFFTMQLARRLFPRGGNRLAFLAFFALATNYEFLRLSLDCRVDMFFSLLVFMAIAAVVERLAEEGRAARAEVLKKTVPVFFIASGLAVLVKGPLGIVLPYIIIVAVLCIFSGYSRLVQFLRCGGVWCLISIFLASSWYVAGALQGANALLDRQLLFENISRFFGGEHVNTRPPWYYLFRGLRASFPWFEVFLISLPLGLKDLYALVQKNSVSGERRNQAICLAVFIIGLLFFSFSSGKRYSYLAPLFPFLSIYVATVLYELWNKKSEMLRAKCCRNGDLLLICVAQYAILTILAFALLTLPWIYPHAVVSSAQTWIATHMLPGISVLTVFLLLLCLMIRFKLFQGEILRRVVLFGTFQAALFCVVFYGFGARNDLPRNEHAARQILAMVGEANSLGVIKKRYDEYFDIVLYYLKHPVTIIDDRNEVLPCKGFYLAKQEWYGPYLERSKMAGFEVEEKARFRQIPDEWAGGTERDMVLFTCRML